PDQHLAVVARQRFQPQDGGAQGPVYAGGAVVQRRAPHAVVHADGGRDGGTGQADAAAALRRVDRVHGVGSSHKGRRGFSTAHSTAAVRNSPANRNTTR